MKLTSITDRRIKRYLKDNSDKYTDCISNESIHAHVKTVDCNGNETTIHVRFSDHFTPNRANEISIIKVNDSAYCLCVGNIVQYTLTDKTIVDFLKAQVLLFKPLKKALIDIDDKRKDILKVYTEYKSKTNEEYINKKDKTIESLKKELEHFKSENESLVNKLKKIKKCFKKYKALINSIELDDEEEIINE